MRQADIRAICTALYDAWSNVEQADSAMWILEKVRSWNLSNDFMEYHIKSAWTIHRNRYYIGKFSFLKKTVAENEQMALDHLYAALAQGNTTANFYLAIIHNYLQDIDSTEYYYDYLMRNGGMSGLPSAKRPAIAPRAETPAVPLQTAAPSVSDTSTWPPTRSRQLSGSAKASCRGANCNTR